MTPGDLTTAAGASDTAVIFRCGPQLLAVATRFVERLLLGDEVGAGEGTAGTWPARLRIDGRPFAAWDLGLMLGLGPQSAAQVLLRLPFRAGAVALALRTGPCVAVKRLPKASPLPGGIFRARPGAVLGVFEAAKALGKPDEALLGYLLEPTALWTEEELQVCAALADSRRAPEDTGRA